MNNQTSAENLVERVETLARTHSCADEANVQVRSGPEPFGDFAVFFGKRIDSESLGKLTLDLASLPELEVAKRSGRRLMLRMAADPIAELGRQLETGAPAGLRTEDLLQGRRYFVDYGDPNATKALHVGHLRCLALGHGVTSILKAAGATVTTLSLVNDIGRSICEAMAGYVEFFSGQTPESASLKSDHFVGRCYSAYVASLAAPDAHEGTLNAPIGRELDERSDLAQNLLTRWTAGDPEVRELWRRIRHWVLEGQDATVQRLGALQDRMLYESVALERSKAMVDEGLSKGIFQSMSGSIVYETGLSEYRHMPLVRRDGFPTENLRLAAVFYDLQPEGRDLAACIHVMGDEWVQLIACRERMLPSFIECPLYDVYHKLGCAMVTFHGSKMKSSNGEALLIDELIDRVAGLPEVVRLSTDGVGPVELARIIILGFYLARKPTKTIEFSWDGFIDPARNAGWQLAAAWSRSLRPLRDGASCDPDPDDPMYRYAVLRSQCLRKSITQAATEYDVSPALDFLCHLSEWYLGIVSTARTDRVMQTVLRTGLSAMGFIDHPRS